MIEKSNAFEQSKGLCVGIDLGTTNSAISILVDGDIPEVLPLRNGKKTLPSCVMYTGGDSFIVGEEAYKQRYLPNVIYSVKRFMGLDTPITLTYGNESKTLLPEEVSSLILKQLCDEIEPTYGKVTSAIITVPAYFNNKQLQKTKKAGELAGLNVLKVMREPTSASLIYDFGNSMENKTILVYDLGGGTFDVSLVQLTGKKTHQSYSEIDKIYGFPEKSKDTAGAKSLTVLCTDGDAHLGGDDLDIELYKIVEQKLKETGIDVSRITKETKEKLILRLEGLKKGGYTNCRIPLVINGISVDIALDYYDFWNATEVIYKKTKKYIDNVLKNIALGNLTSIVLVGGSTKSAILKDMLHRDFPGVTIDDAFNPDEAVARGAAIEAKRILFGDSTLQVYDVVPQNIGIGDMVRGTVSVAIKRNQSIPFISREKTFESTHDGQKTMNINIYQGNSRLLTECEYLGTICLEDLPSKPKGDLQVKIILSVNVSGFLKITTVINGDIKEAVLSNIFQNTDKQATSQSALSKDKKYLRWRKLANTLDDSKQKSLNNLLDIYVENPSEENTTNIVNYIKQYV